MLLFEALTKFITFGQLKNKGSSMSTYLTHIRHLVLYFRNGEIEDITFQDLIDYMDLMLKIGWDRNSLIAKAAAYKQFFKFWQSQGVIKWNAQDIPIPETEHKFPKILEEADYNKLLKAAGEYREGLEKTRAIALLKFLWSTGVRLNELRSIDVFDLDLDNKRAIVKTEKSRGVKPCRMVFWTEDTNKALKDYLVYREKKANGSTALFISGWGRWKTNDRWSESAIEGMLKYLSHKADLGFIANPHRFRHHYGRNLALQGANNSVISDMMGHSDINSTRIYTVMNPEMMQEQYNKYFTKR